MGRSLLDIKTNPADFKFYSGKGYPAETGNGDSLQNIKYGNDTQGGGTSNFLNKWKKQDWVKNPIPENPAQDVPGLGVDQLIRGGALLPKQSSRDILRMTRFLTSENGLVFLAKQQSLYIAEQIQLYGLKQENWRITYNPASPLVNTALAPTGLHLANILLSKGGPSGVNTEGGYLYGQPTLNIPRENNKKYGEGKTYLQKPKDFQSSTNQTSRVDKITTAKLYRKTTADPDIVAADTVPFYITKINNDGSGNNTYIHFRSYIDGLSDAFTGEWGTQKYMGRGENFYFYNGFDRSISLNFKVPVLSKYEQQSVYSKLNYLASLMAPDYSSGGFMRGNLIKLTIGDYITDVPGILSGITYGIDDLAGWDISRNSEGISLRNPEAINDSNADTAGWVMPKLINVSGFTFKPIHSFIPKTINPEYIGSSPLSSGIGGLVDAPFINYGKLNSNTNSGGGYGSGLFKNSPFVTNSNPSIQGPQLPPISR